MEAELRTYAAEMWATVPSDLVERTLGQVLPLPATVSSSQSLRTAKARWFRMGRPIALAAALTLTMAVAVLAATLVPPWLAAISPAVGQQLGPPAALPASASPGRPGTPVASPTVLTVPAVGSTERPWPEPTERSQTAPRTATPAPNSTAGSSPWVAPLDDDDTDRPKPDTQPSAEVIVDDADGSNSPIVPTDGEAADGAVAP